MKKVISFFPNTVIIAILAASVQTLDQLIVKSGGIGPLVNGGAWIAFQSWAVYFLAGSTPKGGFRGLIGYMLGITASIAIFELSGLFASLGFWAVPAALLILVVPVIYLMIAPEPFNLVPALFIGSGVFFGIMSYVTTFPAGASAWTKYGMTAFGELSYCVIGLIAGWVTVTLLSLLPSAKAQQGN